MATRPVFVVADPPNLVRAVELEFEWFPGFSLAQKQRSLRALHQAANMQSLAPVLEVSTKSNQPLGVKLSAFSLELLLHDGTSATVEAAYQASKCFEAGGPYTDLLRVRPRDAKRDPRLKTSGELKGFNFLGQSFPLVPTSMFYDWLYILALSLHPDLSAAVLKYSAFTDIEFNPDKAVSTQAHACAAFVALVRRQLLDPSAVDAVSLKDLLLQGKDAP